MTNRIFNDTKLQYYLISFFVVKGSICFQNNISSSTCLRFSLLIQGHFQALLLSRLLLHLKGSVVDRVLVLSGMGTDEFIKFNNEQNDGVCLHIEEYKFRLSDNDAKELIKKLSGCNNMSELQLLERARRDEYIKN